MTDPKKSILRRAGSGFVTYFTPWRSIARAADSVKTSAANIKDVAQGTRESMRAQHERIQAAKQIQLTPEQAAMTPAELFQDSYDRLGWTEEALARNRAQFRRAKWACMALGAFAFGSGVFMLLASTPLLAFFVAPTLLVASLIIVSRGALEAWKQTQIELRSVANFKWFMSRPDFFKRLVV